MTQDYDSGAHPVRGGFQRALASVDGAGEVSVAYTEAFKARSPLLVADPEVFASSRFG